MYIESKHLPELINRYDLAKVKVIYWEKNGHRRLYLPDHEFTHEVYGKASIYIDLTTTDLKIKFPKWDDIFNSDFKRYCNSLYAQLAFLTRPMVEPTDLITRF